MTQETVRGETVRLGDVLPVAEGSSNMATTPPCPTTNSGDTDGTTRRYGSCGSARGKATEPPTCSETESIRLADYPLMLRASARLRRLHEARQQLRVHPIWQANLEDAERQLNECRTCMGLDGCMTSVRGTHDVIEPAVHWRSEDIEYVRDGVHILRIVAVPCRHSRIAIEARKDERAGLSKRMEVRRWEDIRNNGNIVAMAKVCRAYAEGSEWRDRGDSLWVEGPTGVGKGMVADLVLREMRKRQPDVWRINAGELVEARKAQWDGERGPNPIERAKNVGILCIDEFGQNPASDWESGMWADLLDHRYRYQRPTIITTNIHAEADKRREHEDHVARHYGDAGRRIESRLREAYVCVRIVAPDYREVIGKQRGTR